MFVLGIYPQLVLGVINSTVRAAWLKVNWTLLTMLAWTIYISFLGARC